MLFLILELFLRLLCVPFYVIAKITGIIPRRELGFRSGLYDVIEITIRAICNILESIGMVFTLVVSNKAAPNRKKVVVVGGGFAGASVARTLQRDFDVTLIDDKQYWEYTPSIIKTAPYPGITHRCQFDHESYLPNANVCIDRVTKVSKNSVITRRKDTFKFDYLVLATGTKPKDLGLTPTNSGSVLRDSVDALKDASQVLIVGGGIVGVELCAEINAKYPSKKIFLVHGHNRLIQRMPVAASDYALSYLKSRGVSVVLGTKVTVQVSKGVYLTNTGSQIEADIAYQCMGSSPNTGDLLPATNSVNKSGFIRVNQYLQTTHARHIFACGDISGVREEKLAQCAELQAHVVAHNIKAMTTGAPLKEYKPLSRIVVVSLGLYDGFIAWGNTVYTGVLWRPFAVVLKYLVEIKCVASYWIFYIATWIPRCFNKSTKTKIKNT